MSEPTYPVEAILTVAVDATLALGETVKLLAAESEKQWRALADLRDDVHTLAARLPVDAILSVLPQEPER